MSDKTGVKLSELREWAESELRYHAENPDVTSGDAINREAGYDDAMRNLLARLDDGEETADPRPICGSCGRPYPVEDEIPPFEQCYDCAHDELIEPPRVPPPTTS